MEITPLRNNDSLYRIVETINQLVDSKNPELSISNTLVSAANSEKVKYTATDDTFITGEVFTITIPGMYQIYTKGVGRSKYAIKHIKDNSYIQSEEKADAYISDEYLLSAGDQVFFWAVGASHQELTITLKLTASFYDIIERLLGSGSEPDNPNYSRVTSVAGKTGEVELDKADVGLEKVDNIRQYSELNPPPYPVTSVNGKMGNISNLSTVTNLINGSISGAVRSVSSASETSGYKMGLDSFAVGHESKASGHHSHAEGYQTEATGGHSHAEGSNTTASGSSAHAEGQRSEATGDYTHAEGESTKASGRASHTEGYQTEATGEQSHAEGAYTKVAGYQSHAEGNGSKVTGNYAHAEGWRAWAAGDAAHVEGYSSFCHCEYSGHAEGMATVAASTQVVLPIETYSGTVLTVKNDGTFGYLTSVFSRIRVGMEVIVWNIYYANPSYYTYVISSIDKDQFTIILTTEIPSSNFTVRYIAIPEVSLTTRYYPAHTEGRCTIAVGSNSHAEGHESIASGEVSHAEGSKTIASGEAAHAEGYFTTASGRYSHAEGCQTKALDYYSHAEGEETIASGMRSHAEGWGNEASGQDSHAEGNMTVAKGLWSHAGGGGTIANTLQYGIGHFNTDIVGGSTGDISGTGLVIGNGTGVDARSNCFRVQFNGQVFSKGAYSTSGADYAELFEWADSNPNNEDHRGKFVALSGRKIHIAKPGEIPIGVISSTAAIIGNNHSETWQGMYLRDIWGDVLTEYNEIPAETETIQHPAEVALDEDGNEVIVREAWEETRVVQPEFKGMVPILNPDYNPDDPYTPRHERKEWGIVGLYGQLIVIDDGSCQVNGYCTCTENGTATSSENGYLVIERLDDTHIRILSNFLNTQQQVDTLKEETLSTMEAVTQVYEQGVESGDTAVTSMEAITQNYESILELQATVQKLQEEIQMLKGV